MELIGKYTIGGRVLNRHGEPVEGVYVIGKYGLPYICANLDDKLEKEDRIIVLNDLDTAQNYIRYMSRLYRYEFRERAKKLGVNAGEFRYYLLKLTDERFKNMRIGAKSSEKLRKDSHKRYKFYGDYEKIRLQSIEPIDKG
jgi:hypothetical protein